MKKPINSGKAFGFTKNSPQGPLGLLGLVLLLGACKQDFNLSLLPTQDSSSTSGNPENTTDLGSNPDTGTSNSANPDTNTNIDNPTLDNPAVPPITPPRGQGPMSNYVTFSQELQILAQSVPKQIVFVMDTSGSMTEEINTAVASLTDFSAAFTQTGRNYKIGVTATDVTGEVGQQFQNTAYNGFWNAGPGSFMSSLLNPQPRSKWVDSSNHTAEQALALLRNNFNVTKDGSGHEAGLLAIQAAVSQGHIGAGMWNEGFFVRNSQIDVVFITDEDESAGTTAEKLAGGFSSPGHYVRRNPAFATARVEKTRSDLQALNDIAFRSQVKAHVIGGVPNSPHLNGCPLNRDLNNEPGGILGTANTYIELAQATNGQVIDICEIVDGVRGDFSEKLAFLGQSIAAAFPSVFNLEKVPADATTVRVWLNDVELERGNRTQGFEYNATTNAIELGSFVEGLTMGFALRFTYSVAAP